MRGSRARFTHMLLLKDGKWQASRILSYDHQPPVFVNKLAVVELPAAALDSLTGTYLAKNKEEAQVSREGKSLLLNFGSKMVMWPSGPDQFFVKDRDLTMRFTRAANGKGATLSVREAGELVEELSAK